MRVGHYAIGSLDVIVEDIRRADADGFPTVWTHQAFGADPFIAMALASREAPRIEMGTALLPAILRHPQALAAEALTTQSSLGGRLTLGIGMSHPHVVEGRLGMSYAAPSPVHERVLEALLPLLRGEPADFRGERLTMVGGLDLGDVERPSVLLGALQLHMLRLAGRLADGAITAATGPRGLAEYVVPAITRAAADAGRPPPRIVATVVVCITDDAEGARRRIAATSKPYATFPIFKAVLEREGVGSQVDVGIVGNEETARAKAHRLVEAGATEGSRSENPRAHARKRSRPTAFLRSLLDA